MLSYRSWYETIGRGKYGHPQIDHDLYQRAYSDYVVSGGVEMGMSIMDLDVDYRVRNTLRRFGRYETVEEVQEVSDEQLLRIRNFGPAMLVKLKEALELEGGSLQEVVERRIARVRAEADQRVEDVENRFRNQKEALVQSLEERETQAAADLQRATSLLEEAEEAMRTAETRGLRVTTLEPLLQGGDLVREYYASQRKNWEFFIDDGGNYSKTHPVLVTTLKLTTRWRIHTELKESAHYNHQKLLDELLSKPAELLKVYEQIEAASEVAERLESIRLEISVLLEPLELVQDILRGGGLDGNDVPVHSGPV